MDGERAAAVRQWLHTWRVIAQEDSPPAFREQKHDGTSHLTMHMLWPNGRAVIPARMTFHYLRYRRPRFDTGQHSPTLAPTPRSDQDRGFPRTHEHGLRMADVLREVPHG